MTKISEATLRTVAGTVDPTLVRFPADKSDEAGAARNSSFTLQDILNSASSAPTFTVTLNVSGPGTASVVEGTTIESGKTFTVVAQDGFVIASVDSGPATEKQGIAYGDPVAGNVTVDVTTVAATVGEDARVYRVAEVAGTTRATAPTVGDASVASWGVGSAIYRNLDSGIRQRWLADSTTTATLDQEEFPDDQSPLSALPFNNGDADPTNGWTAGDYYVYNNAGTLERYDVVSGPGTTLLSVLVSYSGTGGGSHPDLATHVALGLVPTLTVVRNRAIAANNINVAFGEHLIIPVTNATEGDTVTIDASPAFVVGTEQRAEVVNNSGVNLVLAKNAADSYDGTVSTIIPIGGAFTIKLTAANTIEVVGTGAGLSKGVRTANSSTLDLVEGNFKVQNLTILTINETISAANFDDGTTGQFSIINGAGADSTLTWSATFVAMDETHTLPTTLTTAKRVNYGFVVKDSRVELTYLGVSAA